MTTLRQFYDTWDRIRDDAEFSAFLPYLGWARHVPQGPIDSPFKVALNRESWLTIQLAEAPRRSDDFDRYVSARIAWISLSTMAAAALNDATWRRYLDAAVNLIGAINPGLDRDARWDLLNDIGTGSTRNQIHGKKAPPRRVAVAGVTYSVAVDELAGGAVVTLTATFATRGAQKHAQPLDDGREPP